MPNLPIGLGGKTALTPISPHMNLLAKTGTWPLVQCPGRIPPGSDVATLSLLGYDPTECYRSCAARAAAQGIALGANDWAFRCNLVCLQDGKMKSFTADHISTGRGQRLLAGLQVKSRPAGMPSRPARGRRVFPGVGYRNLLIYRPENRNGFRVLFARQTFPPTTPTRYAQALRPVRGEALRA